MKDRKAIVALKGMIVGGTMLVPGVSGGSMAMILGIYGRLVSSVSSFLKDKKNNFLFLLVFCLGAGVGMILFANPLLGLINRYPMPMLYFFMGAVAGGIPLIYKQAEITSFSWKIPVYIIVGIVLVVLLSKLPTEGFSMELNGGVDDMIMPVIAGIIAAVALILPGISVSYLMLVMGLYDVLMESIGSLYLPFLVPLAVGLLLGILLTTRILERAMNQYPQPTYMIILGFVIGSVGEVFPGVPSLGQMPICVITLVAGFAVIYFLSRQEIEKTEE